MTYAFSNRSAFSASAIAASLVCSLGLSSPAWAETTECTVISSLPYTITDQGVYCLKGHLNTNITSDSAITIETNNVTIDLNGYKLGGLAAGTGTLASGIYANDRKNITIRNGTVRGFLAGIYLNGGLSQGHLIEDVRVDMNRARGIWIVGNGHTIRQNQIVATGGSTEWLGATAIQAFGDNIRIMDNDVTDTHGSSTSNLDWGSGIVLVGTGGIITHNRVSGVVNPGNPTDTVGINPSGPTTTMMVIGNEVMDAGQSCILFDGGATGVYRDNTVSGCTTDYSGGTDGGGNFP